MPWSATHRCLVHVLSYTASALKGPSMWPHLSSSFYDLPTSCTQSPCGRLDGSVSPDLGWWLHDPWSSLAPNDLLSVVTARGHAPDLACARGACEARGGPPLLIIGSRCEPVPPNEWSIPA